MKSVHIITLLFVLTAYSQEQKSKIKNDYSADIEVVDIGYKK